MAEERDKAFLGRGWAFPVQPAGAAQPREDVQMAEYEEDIRQAILIILQTNHGERVMRPDFGANLNALLFQPLNTTTMSLARYHVEQALITWEPRIDQISVKVGANRPQGRLDIEIIYRVRSTNTFYNLVYPFYLQEGQ